MESGELDMVGFGRPFLLDQRFPAGFLDASLDQVESIFLKGIPRQILDIAEAGWYDYQIHQLAKGRSLSMNYSGLIATLRFTNNELVKGIRNRIWG